MTTDARTRISDEELGAIARRLPLWRDFGTHIAISFTERDAVIAELQARRAAICETCQWKDRCDIRTAAICDESFGADRDMSGFGCRWHSPRPASPQGRQEE